MTCRLIALGSVLVIIVLSSLYCARRRSSTRESSSRRGKTLARMWGSRECATVTGPELIMHKYSPVLENVDDISGLDDTSTRVAFFLLRTSDR